MLICPLLRKKRSPLHNERKKLLSLGGMQKQEKKIIRRRIIRSYVCSVITISMVLFLVGFFALLALNGRELARYLRQNVKISVMLKDTVSERNAIAICRDVARLKQVKSAELISKERGTEQMKQMLGSDFLDIFEANPIPISIDLQLNASFFDAVSIGQLRGELLKNKSIDDVVYQDSVISAMNRNIRNIGFVIVVFIALLLFISIILINNTVRLNIFSKRFSIHTMNLVGATKQFIRRPFLYNAIFQGVLSGVIALLALLGLVWLAHNQFSASFILVSRQMLYFIAGGVVLLGVLICLVCTLFVVNRMVSMSVDELYY